MPQVNLLVRARVKPREEWPSWTRCCDYAKAQAESNFRYMGSEILVKIGRVIAYPYRGECRCGVTYPEFKAYQVASGNGQGLWTPIEWLDLDEAPAEKVGA